MLRKFLKGGVITGVGIATAAFVFPDHFTPVQKVVNVGVAGAKIYYVYKFNHDKTIP